ncbi:ADP-ribosylglycohydrolase family protein [Neolewinella antarctica]|uniref:Heme biosynthesis protein HemY n=1 Tax=Neolewinella antarctica TaxID=442734 RepID=A0ABX0XFS4_9BACT|nr:ADP-ribosylglycohydrolase family protein [Neolewinella antarctica]NJC27754.1 hypothetical protein [Neolewinella antarctica]
MMKLTMTALLLTGLLTSCGTEEITTPRNPDLTYTTGAKQRTDLVIDRKAYYEQLQGFWLGTCIANWTGLVTEMDKIGNIGDLQTGDFYTRDDWGKIDEPSIWGEGVPSDLSETIDFVFSPPDSTWGSDDDTDIEYIYQELLLANKTSLLTGEQIRDGWLKHIRKEEENYLWVSNQKAFDLMGEGLVPPATGDPANNPEYEMIDAQLTTEIFGLYAPGMPALARKIAKLPIQTTARYDSEWISEFYVTMFSLASVVDKELPMQDRMLWMADAASRNLPDTSYAKKMYDFVLEKYRQDLPWEQTRDSLYQRYQVEERDGYTITSQNRYCNGCFAAGINFGASLISLFYGEGDFVETIKIGALAGWDSDNPTATWGGLIGFMIGKAEIERLFDRKFSDKFYIHRTRRGFGGDGIDTFDRMALKGVWIVDRLVQAEAGGVVDLERDSWRIPAVRAFTLDF